MMQVNVVNRHVDTGMRSRFDNSGWMNVYLIITFVIAFDCFGVIGSEGLTSIFLSSKLLLSIVCIGGAFLFLLSSKGRSVPLIGTFFSGYYCFFFISVTLVAILTVNAYPSVDKLRVFSRWASYLTVSFVFIAMVYCYGKRNGLFELLLLLEKVATVGYCLYFLNALAFQVTGNLMLPGQAFLGDHEHANVRYFLVRLSTPLLFDISVIASFVFAIAGAKNQKRFHLISFILGLFVVVGISQSRAEMAAVIAACFIALVIRYGHTHPVLAIISSLAVLSIAMFFAGLFDQIVGLFYQNGAVESSTLIRGKSVDYYMSIFSRNPLYGFGFISGSDSYYLLEHGVSGQAWISDVGIFGQLAHWGIFFGLIYFGFIARAVYITVGRWRAMPTSVKCLVLASLVYVALTSYSQISLSVTSGLVFPFLVAIFEFVDKGTAYKGRMCLIQADERG